MLRANLIQWEKQRYRVLGLMLFVYHFALWNVDSAATSVTLMLVSLGLFLVWQPFLNRLEPLNWGAAAIYAVVLGAFLVGAREGFIAAWGVLLVGLLGSGIADTRERYINIAAIIFLFLELFVVAVPRIFEIASVPLTDLQVFGYALMPIPLVLLFLNSRILLQQSHQIDFFRGLTLSLITISLAMGSVLKMYQSNESYPTALMKTFFAMGVFLMILGWLWSPRTGYKGLLPLWNRYLMNVGTPVEEFLLALTQEAKIEDEPKRFLRHALDMFAALDWVEGVTWKSASGAGTIGVENENLSQMEMSVGDLRLTVLTLRPMGPTLLLHTKLLVNLLAFFYISKQREMRLAQRAQTEAIHETGARLTHDIKNVLQSMKTLTSLIESSAPDEAQNIVTLVKRQLPALNERLQLTVEKLRSPQLETVTKQSVEQWWQQLLDRNLGRRITFENRVAEDVELTQELFDTVVDNLLENARVKRLTQKDVDIELLLSMSESGPVLRVRDTGWQIDERLAHRLFREAVDSDTGLGIGLYQCGKLADQFGYRLHLQENSSRWVSFVLEPRAGS